MANIINGTFTLQDVLRFTSSMFKNRFKYRDRDVLKSIRIIQVKRYNPSKVGEPTILYRILTFSYPQYKPYYKGVDKRGREIKFQRTIKHEYDCILEMDELSLTTSNWKGRIGSGKKWIDKPPQKQIGTIYKKTKDKWKKQAERNNKLKTKKAKIEWIKEKINEHKRKARYIDVGDWNSRVQGINGDFRFRCAYVWKRYGHLYGYQHGSNLPANIRNPKNIMFFPKHFLRLIEILMNKGIIGL